MLNLICTTVLIEKSPQALPLGAACVASAIKNSSKTKELLWICYGDIIVENLNRNLDKKTKVCVKCGKRFEPYTNSQKYCLKCDCGYQKIGKKVLFCSDCGEQFVVNSKNNASKRCPDCYKIYRNKYNNDIPEEIQKFLNPSSEIRFMKQALPVEEKDSNMQHLEELLSVKEPVKEPEIINIPDVVEIMVKELLSEKT